MNSTGLWYDTTTAEILTSLPRTAHADNFLVVNFPAATTQMKARAGYLPINDINDPPPNWEDNAWIEARFTIFPDHVRRTFVRRRNTNRDPYLVD